MQPSEIRAIRIRAGLSQANLARAMRVRTRTVQKWEHGDRKCEGAATVVLELLYTGELPARFFGE